jgi:sugar lactone lactonase YvrE
MKASRELRQVNLIASVLLTLLFNLPGTLNVHAQSKAKLVAVVEEKDIIPEGITYDAQSKTIFLSSIQKNKIVAINEKGEARDFVSSGKDGLQQVLGMKVVDGKLWACNNTPEHDTIDRVANVHVYDLASAKLLKKITIKGGKHLFNDLFIARSGDAYVTDSDGGGVYVIRHGTETAEPFIEGKKFPYPNGITATEDEKKIIMSTGGGHGLASIDLQTKEIVSITHSKFLIIGADGLYRYKNKLIAVQNVVFPEGILEMQLSSDGKTVSDIKHLAVSLPEFDTPTTGVIVGDDFYFIANSQLTQIIGGGGKIKDPQTLKETSIMKIKLN